MATRLYTAIASLICMLQLARGGVECPNNEFAYVQTKGQRMRFENSRAQYFSYGSDGFWSIEIAKATPDAPIQCGDRTFVEILGDREKELYLKAQQNAFGNEDQDSLATIPQSCCVRPLSYDYKKENKEHHYNIFPDEFISHLLDTTIDEEWSKQADQNNGVLMSLVTGNKKSSKSQAARKKTELTMDQVITQRQQSKQQVDYAWRWIQIKSNHASTFIKYFLVRIPVVQEVQMDCVYVLNQFAYSPTLYECRFLLHGYTLPAATWKDCYPSLTHCDTGNVLTLTVFVLRYTHSLKGINKRITYEYVRFGFSESGIFNVKDMFKDFTSASRSDLKIMYSTMVEFSATVFKTHEGQFRVEVNPEWQLASTCAACPSQSVSIKVSEKRAVSQKKKINNAMSLKLSIGSAKMLPVAGNVGVGYTRSILNEVGESLSTGTATTIKAKCNAFNLYHYGVTVVGWGGGDSRVLTRYFYCTDRPTPPKCIPEGENMAAGFNQQLTNHLKPHFCSNYDTNSDWQREPTPNQVQAAWRSMHSGRPKPINIDPFKLGAHGTIGAWVFDTKTGKVEQKRNKAPPKLNVNMAAIDALAKKRTKEGLEEELKRLEKGLKDVRDKPIRGKSSRVSGTSTPRSGTSTPVSGTSTGATGGTTGTGDSITIKKAMQEELNFMPAKRSIHTGVHRKKTRNGYRKSRLLLRNLNN